jgi:hypothetical protein
MMFGMKEWNAGEEKRGVLNYESVTNGGAVAQLGARLDGIEEVVGSNPIGSTNSEKIQPRKPFGKIQPRNRCCSSLLLWRRSVPV